MSVHAAALPTLSNRSIGWAPFALVALVVVPRRGQRPTFLKVLRGREVVSLKVEAGGRTDVINTS